MMCTKCVMCINCTVYESVAWDALLLYYLVSEDSRRLPEVLEKFHKEIVFALGPEQTTDKLDFFLFPIEG